MAKSTETTADEQVKETTADEAVIEQATPNDPWQDKVPVTLPYDGDKYKDDLFVAVNGRTFLIKRGVAVMVPRCVKEVIDAAQKQSIKAVDYSRQLEAQLEAQSKNN